MSAIACGPLPRPSAHYFRKCNLEMTTVCNLTCPECSAATNGSGMRKQRHHPWEYFVEAARWIYGVESLVITGGEATSHPKFAEFIPRFRELFGCREMILWTNGFKVKEYADLIAANFDAVYASLYDEHTAPWIKRPNTDLVTFIKTTFNHATMELPHVPRARRGSGDICDRGEHGPFAYADGKLYGCCVAPGLAEGIGITPSLDWKREILETPLPCATCFLSPSLESAA